MRDNSNNEELMVFIDETPRSEKDAVEQKRENVWRILITDDEQDVHSATTFALRNTKVLGRRLEFLHAKSAQETIDILKNKQDIAVILLDVVMETPNVGLDLVAIIRKQLKITDTRIILRTGQPNQAPEIEVIRDYDINDYKLKSELTQTKLYAALTTAVRSYKQIRMIEASKRGLGLIVKSSGDLLSQQGLNAFAHGVILQLAGLMSVPAEGLICAHYGSSERVEDSLIIAAAGNYCQLINKPLSELAAQEVRDPLTASLTRRCHIFADNGLALYLGSDQRGGMSCYVANSSNIDDVDADLLELFCHNIRVFADNLSLLEKLKNHAYIDDLVALPNKLSLSEQLDKTLNGTQQQHHSLALLTIDDFPEIKLSLGNKYAEGVAKAVAQRLRKAFPDAATVAKLSDDSFAIFGNSDILDHDSILSPFLSPFEIESHQQIISATAVLRVFDQNEQSTPHIIRQSQLLLDNTKKRAKGSIELFSHSKLEEVALHFDLLNDVRNSFELDKLYLSFQPKFSLKTGTMTGLEALVRWKKEDGEVILPTHFIPLAERSGLIIKLGEWILRSALTTLARLNQAGIRHIGMSVNISAVQFQHAEMLATLDKVVKDCAVAPEDIDLEITESVAINAVSSNLALIEELNARGFQLSVDDFGTGLSSLHFLKQAHVNTLKIDQVFVNACDTANGRELIEMIIHLATTLNLAVVAEGVETEEQKKILSDLGCEQAQGFYLAEPMDEQALFTWLQDTNGRL